MKRNVLVIYGNSAKATSEFAGTLAELLKERVSCPVFAYEGAVKNDFDGHGKQIPDGIHVIGACPKNTDMPVGPLLEHFAYRYGNYSVSCVGLITEQQQAGNVFSVQISKNKVMELAEMFRDKDREMERAASELHDVGHGRDSVPVFRFDEEKLLQQLDEKPAELDLVSDLLDYMSVLAGTDDDPNVVASDLFERMLEGYRDGDPGVDTIARVYNCPGESWLRYPEVAEKAGHIMVVDDGPSFKRNAQVGRSDVYGALYNTLYGGRYGNYMPRFDDFVDEVWDRFRYDLDMKTIFMDRDGGIGFDNGVLSWNPEKADYDFKPYGKKFRRRMDLAHVNAQYESGSRQLGRLDPAERDILRAVTEVFGETSLFLKFLGRCMKPGGHAGILFDIVGSEKSIQMILDILHELCWYGSGKTGVDKAFHPYCTVHMDNVHGCDFEPSNQGTCSDFGMACVPMISNHAILRFWTDEVRMDQSRFSRPPESCVLGAAGEVKAWKKLKAGVRQRIVRCLAALAAEHVLQSADEPFAPDSRPDDGGGES